MSKLNNLIGFWNSKSLEQGEPKNRQKQTRPKSEIIDRNFVRRMENLSAVESPRQRGGVSFLLSEERGPQERRIKDVVRPGADSDHKTRVQAERDCTDRSGQSLESAKSGKRGLAQSTPGSPASSTKPQSPFAKFQQLENNLCSSGDSRVPGTRTPPLGGIRPTNLYRNASMPASTVRPTVTHKMMEQKNNSGSRSVMAARSGSGAKEMILMWVQNRIKDYPIPMTNFSTHWNDGLAFCALIHVFYPDNFDWFSLKSENRRHNFTLAFQKAEELAGIYPLLEVDDMVRFQKPDWKCVFTYVQSFYRRFRDGRSPPRARTVQAGAELATAPGQINLSEVARAVAECQEAEESGRNIVKQLSCQDNTENKVAVTEAEQTEKMVVKQLSIESKSQEEEQQQEEKEEEERLAEKDEVCSDLPCRAVESVPLTPPEETPAEVHTESVCITLKPSPSPKISSAKISRSKSVATDHPDAEEDSSVQERKLSFNHPMPSMSPPALTL